MYGFGKTRCDWTIWLYTTYLIFCITTAGPLPKAPGAHCSLSLASNSPPPAIQASNRISLVPGVGCMVANCNDFSFNVVQSILNIVTVIIIEGCRNSEVVSGDRGFLPGSSVVTLRPGSSGLLQLVVSCCQQRVMLFESFRRLFYFEPV